MAEETFELYSLTNRLTLDTSQFDRAYAASRSKMQTLGGDLNKLQTQSGNASQELDQGMGGALDSLVARFGLAAGAAGAFTTGIGIGAGVYAAAGKAIFDLADSTAKAQGKFHDLANETNFSVEFLSSLSPLAIAAGKDVDDLSTSLVIFQRNLVKGGDAFEFLGVTSRNNEVALRQAAKGLFNVKDGAQQTALAMEVFGKSGRAMLAVIKDSNGDLDQAAKFWKKWGLTISAETAAAADDFGDSMDRIGLRLTGIKQQIGQETIPAFNSLFTAIEAALDANQTNWKWWGEQIAKVVLTVGTVMGGLANAISKADFKSPLGPVKFLMDFKEGMESTADALVAEYLKRLNPTVGIDVRSALPGPGWSPGKDKPRKGSGGQDPLSNYNRSLALTLQDKLGQFDEEENALKRSLERRTLLHESYATQAKDIEERKHLSIMASMVHEADGIEQIKNASEKALAIQELGNKKRAEERRHKEALAQIDDQQIDRTRQLAEMAFQFEKGQRDQWRAATGGAKTAFDAVREFEAAYLTLGGTLEKGQSWWRNFYALQIEGSKHMQKVAEFMRSMSENATGPPEIKFPERQGEYPGPNMPAPPVMKEDPILKWRRLAEHLSYDIAYTVENSIRAGFADGVDEGVKEFLRGLAEIAQSEALQMLRRAIANIFGNDPSAGGASSGASGSLLSAIIRFGVAAAGSVAGGGGGGGLGSAAANAFKAGGGYVPAGQWYFAGDRGTELIKSGPRGDTVYPHGESMEMLAMAGGGGQTVNIYAQDVRAAFSRQTMTQAKSKLARLQRGR